MHKVNIEIIDPESGEIIARSGGASPDILERIRALGEAMAPVLTPYDFDKHGAILGSYCPLLRGICAYELDRLGLCPFEDGCPDEWDESPGWDLVVTESGVICKEL